MLSDPHSEAAQRVPRRKVRVLFLNDTARNGGPGRSLFYLLKFLDPQVVHRTVVLPRRGVIGDLLAPVADDLHFEPNLVESAFEPWTRAIARDDLHATLPRRAVRALGNVARGAHGLASLTMLARRGRFDLVYCNGTTACFAGAAMAWTTGVPTLWHVRYTSVPRALVHVHSGLAASRGVRRILCVSRAAASLFPHCSEKVRVIHNALDVDEFTCESVAPRLRTEIAALAGTVVFGSQGRVLPHKGFRELVHAAKIALDAMTPSERRLTRFVVLGDTPADFARDHLEECRALARALDVADEVVFLGFRADVKPYVADYDVAIVPSVFADPLPRAVLESMAMGKPVIAFDLGGIAEMVDDGTTGALVKGDPPDVAALAAQILRYRRDPELRTRQGKLARQRIEMSFDAARETRVIQNEIISASGLAS